MDEAYAKDRRYNERKCRQLSTWARQSFSSTCPSLNPRLSKALVSQIESGELADVFVLDTRSYRGPNSRGRQRRLSASSQVLGPAQVQWLVDGLSQSNAIWKLIVCPQPLGLNVYDGPGKLDGFANNHAGAPRGRELELAYLLSEIQARAVKNIAWFTADVHYAAAHHFHLTELNLNNLLRFGSSGRSSQRSDFRSQWSNQPLDQSSLSILTQGLKPGASPLSPISFWFGAHRRIE